MNHLPFNSNTMHASIPGEERIAALAAHVLTAAEVVTVHLRLGPRTKRHLQYSIDTQTVINFKKIGIE